MQLSCRGFWNNRHIVSEAIRSINPDIVFFNHTGLPLNPITLYGYNTRHSTGTTHDGVAAMVKSTLRHVVGRRVTVEPLALWGPWDPRAHRFEY